MLGGDLVGDGILEPYLCLLVPDQRRHDAPRIAGKAALGEEGHDVDGPYQPGRAQGEIAHVARPDADAVERAAARRACNIVEAGHSASLASALTAAAAMALPPLRPLTIRNGTRPSAASTSFDSFAPTKPTGRPITAAG